MSDDHKTSFRRLILGAANALLNYVLFSQLALFFWYGTEELYGVVVTGGESGEERVRRAVLGLLASSAVEILAAIFDQELQFLGEEIRQDAGYVAFFLFTRLYNYVMAVANVFLYASVQVFYEEYVGEEGVDSLTGNAGWAAAVLVVIYSLRIARAQISSPFVVCLDSRAEKDWFSFSFYFERSRHLLPDRLLNAVFSVVVVSSILNVYWIALGFTFDLAIYPTCVMSSVVASCVIGYVIIGVLKLSTKATADVSTKLEESGRHGLKLLVEDVYMFGANFSVILLWKGLNSNAMLVSRAVGPLLMLDPCVVAVCNQILAFLVMALLDVSCLVVFKGPSIDGTLTEGRGVDFDTQYLTSVKVSRQIGS